MNTTTTKMPEILIIIPKEDEQTLADLKTHAPNDIAIVETKNFDGLVEVVQALVTISASLLPYILQTIKERRKEKKDITVKYNGIEIRLENEEQLEAFMKELIEQEKKNKETDD